MTLTDHDKAQIEKIKPNTKIRILSEEHRYYVSILINHINPTQIDLYTHAYFVFFKVRGSGMTEWTYTDSSVDFCGSHEYKEIFIDLPPKEPKIAESHNVDKKIKPPFKFRNANLPVVRQWLKDNGYRFKDENMDIIKANLHHFIGRVDEHGYFWCCSLLDNEYISIYHEDLPELIFNIEAKITSFSIDNTAEIAKLESELEALRVRADEIQDKLGKLKS